MAQRWTIPQPLAMDWPFKPLSSAQTSVARLSNGQLELTIKHDLLRGVTREMLSWWFRRIDGTMVYHGRRVPRYRVWHPRDHIFYRDLTRDAEGLGGARTRRQIVEAFAENPSYLVNIVDRVAHLDEDGILLVTERAGLSLGRLRTPLLPLPGEVSTLQHWFIAAPTGTRYESRMLVGSDSLLGRLLLNRYVLPRVAMPEAMGRAWLRHNVEEVGNFERFLPALFAEWTERGETAFGVGDRQVTVKAR
ncbi:MAG TPA: hypothetical protein PKD53_15750 [Chloroflexaceae bacterium]|nr:hypothetical protein [Chloroflexaceae bacterium]